MKLRLLFLALPLAACAPDPQAKAEQPMPDAKLARVTRVADSLSDVVWKLRDSSKGAPETTGHVVPVHRVIANVKGLGPREWPDVWMWWVRGDHTFLVRTAAWHLRQDSVDTCERGCIKVPTSAVLLTEHYRDTVILRIK